MLRNYSSCPFISSFKNGSTRIFNNKTIIIINFWIKFQIYICFPAVHSATKFVRSFLPNTNWLGSRLTSSSSPGLKDLPNAGDTISLKTIPQRYNGFPQIITDHILSTMSIHTYDLNYLYNNIWTFKIHSLTIIVNYHNILFSNKNIHLYFQLTERIFKYKVQRGYQN